MIDFLQNTSQVIRVSLLYLLSFSFECYNLGHNYDLAILYLIFNFEKSFQS